MLAPKIRNKRQSGQSLLEYVFLLLVVVGLVSIVYGRLGGTLDLLETPLTRDFPYTYRYGDPKARGFDDGEPTRHPGIYRADNFKFFARGN